MTVAGINIFLFIAWVVVADAILGAGLTVLMLFVADIIGRITHGNQS